MQDNDCCAELMAKYQPFMLCCDDKGKIIEANNRAKSAGFEISTFIQHYLIDISSQRTWMQVLAEISLGLPQGLFSFSASANGQTVNFECIGHVGENLDENRLFLSGVQASASSIQGHSFVPVSPCSTTEHKYVYDMSLLDSDENAVIASDYLGRIIYFSESAKKMYGYTSEEAIGNYCKDLLCHSESQDYGVEIMEKLKEGEKWQGFFLTRNKAGDPLSTYVTDYPIFDQEGKVIGIVGVSCFKKDSQASIACDNTCAVNESIPVLLTQLNYLTDSARPVWCNESFLRVMGLSSLPNDKSIKSLLGIPHGKPFNGFVLETKEKNHLMIEAIELPSHNSTLIILRDASIKKKLEVSLRTATEQAETRAFKTDFITTMSHELRTPLHILCGEIEHLAHSVQEFKNKEAVSKEAAEQMSNSIESIRYCYNLQFTLVKNVLDWQKFSSGKLNVILNSFKIRQVIEEIERNIRFLIHVRNIKFHVNIDDKVPGSIVSDESKIMHILINLLTNAAKYTFQDTDIHLNVSVLKEGNLKEEKIYIEIVDHGPGIGKSVRHLLFQRFAQLRPKEPDQRGVGLGLNISKQLVELLGGFIGYKDTPGGGSTFWFCFPFHLSNSVEITCNSKMSNESTISTNHDYNMNTAKKQEYNPSIIKGIKRKSDEPAILNYDITDEIASFFSPILIADDNIINQKTLERMLRKIGFKKGICDINFAIDGQEAVEKASTTKYQCILMDMSMPRLDGVGATKILRKKGFKDLIFGVTANAMDEHRDTCIDAGMNEFMVKPLKSKDLCQMFLKFYR